MDAGPRVFHADLGELARSVADDGALHEETAQRRAALEQMVSEFSLAFPLEDCHLDWQSQLAGITRKYSQRLYDGEVLAAAAAFSKSFCGDSDSGPPECVTPASDDACQNLDALLAKATPTTHLKSAVVQKLLDSICKSYDDAMPKLIQNYPAWSMTSNVVERCLPFCSEDQHSLKLKIGALKTLHHWTSAQGKFIADGTFDNPGLLHMPQLLARAMRRAKEALAKLEGGLGRPTEQSESDAPAASIISDAFFQKIRQAHATADNDWDVKKAVLQASFDTFVASDLATWTALAKGDRGDGKSWCNDAPYTALDSWTSLVDMYQTNLRKIKAKELKGAITATKKLWHDIMEVSSAAGASFNSRPLQRICQDLIVTKLIGVVMKDMIKHPDDASLIRDTVRSEIAEAASTLGDDWKFDGLLPKVLCERMADVIAGRSMPRGK
jgi:hypothetical protein